MRYKQKREFIGGGSWKINKTFSYSVRNDTKTWAPVFCGSMARDC